MTKKIHLEEFVIAVYHYLQKNNISYTATRLHEFIVYFREKYGIPEEELNVMQGSHGLYSPVVDREYRSAGRKGFLDSIETTEKIWKRVSEHVSELEHELSSWKWM